MTITQKTGVANHQEATSRNFAESRELGCLCHFALFATHCCCFVYLTFPLTMSLFCIESKLLLIIFAKERLLHAQAFVVTWMCVAFRISLFHHSKWAPFGLLSFPPHNMLHCSLKENNILIYTVHKPRYLLVNRLRMFTFPGTFPGTFPERFCSSNVFIKVFTPVKPVAGTQSLCLCLHTQHQADITLSEVLAFVLCLARKKMKVNSFVLFFSVCVLKSFGK